MKIGLRKTPMDSHYVMLVYCVCCVCVCVLLVFAVVTFYELLSPHGHIISVEVRCACVFVCVSLSRGVLQTNTKQT